MTGEVSPATATNPNQPAKESARWADLGVRALTAASLIPAIVADVWFGGIWFQLLMAFLGVLIAHEWTNIVHGRSSTQFALHGAAALLAAFLPQEIGVLPTIGVSMMLMALGVFAAAMRERERVIWTYAGIPYVAFPVLALTLLRGDDAWGLHAIMWLLLVVWATDSFAYFAGRLIGGPRLAPRWSPSKTWAGLAGGVAGAIVVSVSFAMATGISWLPLAIVAALLAVIAQLGDIFESALKRHHNVKDSGYLIPGHGGIMDRVDGLVFAGVAAAIIGYLRNSNDLAQGLLVW